MPLAPTMLGTAKPVNMSQQRLQNTPATTSAEAAPTTFMLRRFFANTSRQKGMTKPQITSNQKNGAVPPNSSVLITAMPPSVPL